jgi:hypothetical protein
MNPSYKFNRKTILKYLFDKWKTTIYTYYADMFRSLKCILPMSGPSFMIQINRLIKAAD